VSSICLLVQVDPRAHAYKYDIDSGMRTSCRRFGLQHPCRRLKGRSAAFRVPVRCVGPVKTISAERVLAFILHIITGAREAQTQRLRAPAQLPDHSTRPTVRAV